MSCGAKTWQHVLVLLFLGRETVILPRRLLIDNDTPDLYCEVSKDSCINGNPRGIL